MICGHCRTTPTGWRSISTRVASAEALKLQQASYTVGKTSVLQLIDAQRTYAQARLSLATAQIQQFQDTAGLLVGLGGGWWKDQASQAR